MHFSAGTFGSCSAFKKVENSQLRTNDHPNQNHSLTGQYEKGDVGVAVTVTFLQVAAAPTDQRPKFTGRVIKIEKVFKASLISAE